MICEYCGELIIEKTDFSKPNGTDFDSLVCDCAMSKRVRTSEMRKILDKQFEDDLIKAIVNDLPKEEIATIKDDSEMKEKLLSKRLELMNHRLSSVNRDMIKVFSLPENEVKTKIPESYFWKIKVENPLASVTDFIDHMWTIQREDIDISDVKFKTFRSWRKINDRVVRVTAGITVFNSRHFMKKAHSNKAFDGHKINSGMGEYFSPETNELVKEMYVECQVFRKDRRVPATYRAWFPEFVKKDDTGRLYKQWFKPQKALARIAMANAYKLAFPSEVGNINVDYETMEVE